MPCWKIQFWSEKFEITTAVSALAVLNSGEIEEDALSNPPITDVNFSMDSEFLKYMPKRVTKSIFLEDCNPGEVEEIIKRYSNYGKSSDISIYVIRPLLT